MVLGIHHHLPQTEEGLTQTGTLQQVRHLAPTTAEQGGGVRIDIHLDMPIFKLTDPNADVTYTLWRLNVQGWLDQYQEESIMPHTYASLWGYPSRWVHSMEDGPILTVTKLLECMDHTFGDVHEYDTMICSLYEIRQKEGESVEGYML